MKCFVSLRFISSLRVIFSMGGWSTYYILAVYEYDFTCIYLPYADYQFRFLHPLVFFQVSEKVASYSDTLIMIFPELISVQSGWISKWKRWWSVGYEWNYKFGIRLVKIDFGPSHQRKHSRHSVIWSCSIRFGCTELGVSSMILIFTTFHLVVLSWLYT